MNRTSTQDRALSVAIDIGGTFTDVTLFERATGRSWTVKTPSTPSDPSLGFVTGVAQALALSGHSPGDLVQVLHGTTVATNLILEGKGAKAALLTNKGFRHVLEIGRHDVPRDANLYSWIKPDRPVPPERIFEIPGMLAADGTELDALDEAAVSDVARRLRDTGVEAVAICFLHAYLNPAHEHRARELILEQWPDALVSVSSEVLPVMREYERSVATILNAYVCPAVSTYVHRLEARLREMGVRAPLLLMKSNGGVAGATVVKREPVQTALSGPAAGVVGAQVTANLAGFANVIGVDIGGTSADISLIRNGVPGTTTEGSIGAWPLNLPMVDINTIGAGGGSIARVSADKVLSVGPESAGAQPGPVCYRRGGTEPTVTDAHAALGHVPASLLNGAMSLDVDAARRAIDERIARPLGLTIEEAARGILALADNAMVNAIRVVSVQRGHDPRDFALVPFGGAGPLHGASLARLLGIPAVLVPPSPGVLSTIGLLTSKLKSDFSRTSVHRAGRFDYDAIASVFDEMAREARAWLDSEGVPEEGRQIVRKASMHYQHQGAELRVPWPDSDVDEASIAEVVRSFHRQHESLYTFAQEDMPVEIVTLHVEASGTLQPPEWPQLTGGGEAVEAVIGEQAVHFADGTRTTPIYDRSRLAAGVIVEGPAIFVQLDTTTLMLPDQFAEVHAFGSLIIKDRVWRQRDMSSQTTEFSS
ncbi:hydantoin utilization protein A [Pandoraea captiosa]|uniref:Hydantoin utilization protein A n=1 Tax=Pandoraea captiosa TaxID=2508302 RepID=A0A5E4ZIV2_9BURK|nr:hydantoinase/oxoprolinase family protein [Pandoraea captiosa]VVE61289.1 hydantoin utilization protein A [Pandoraea captiosa]